MQALQWRVQALRGHRRKMAAEEFVTVVAMQSAVVSVEIHQHSLAIHDGDGGLNMLGEVWKGSRLPRMSGGGDVRRHDPPSMVGSPLPETLERL
ncbi:MAG: hypothetical protein VR70_03075 [Rhodospirillaceae bacterium BRH_c57]|nr:MAG: hypothetical protein VR70_03075 [Rhodospirillaceae bacterium BRH_c57]